MKYNPRQNNSASIPRRSNNNNNRRLVKLEQEPVHVQLGRASKNYAFFCLKSLGIVTCILFLALALSYTWISQRPVSLSFLVPPLETAIQREMGNVTIKIDDAVVQKAENGFGIVFRLKNIRVLDHSQITIAQAPQASIGLSTWALLFGRVAPASVSFIQPQVILTHNDDGNIGIAFSKRSNEVIKSKLSSDRKNNTAWDDASISNQIGKTLAAAQEKQFDVAKTLKGFIENTRSGNTATSYLSRFGMRDAFVYLKSNNKITEFHVPDIEIDLAHTQTNSIVSGQMRLASKSGSSDLAFHTELNKSKDLLTLWVQLDNFLPSSLADKFPNMQSLKSINIPITGLGRFDLSAKGELLYSETKLELSSGILGHIGAGPEHALSIDKGDLHFRYTKEKGAIEVLQSSLYWGGSYAKLTGGIQSGLDQNGLKFWKFLLESNDAVIATKEFGLPARKVDKWVTSGFIIPQQKRIHLNKFLIQLGQESVELKGDIIDHIGSPEVHLDGTFTPMSISTFKQIWPRFLAPGARNWIGERITKGVITGGSIKAAIPGGLLHTVEHNNADIPKSVVSYILNMKDMETHIIPGLPPLKTQTAQAMLTGRQLEIKIDRSHIDLPTGKQVLFAGGSFAIPDLRKEIPESLITFKTSGDAEALLELLNHKPLEYLKKADMSTNMIKGITTGHMTMTFPLLSDLKFEHIKMDGEVVLSKAVISNITGDMSVNDGTITFGITDKAINAQGNIYVNSIPAQIAWQRIFKGNVGKQPGVRLTANLNGEKLEKLGIPIRHLVRGDIPTILTMRSTENGKRKIQLQANLSQAELILGNLGWSKPPGKRAVIEFDINQLNTGSTELRNFKIIGDDIAVKGEMFLNEEGDLYKFSFPDFSVDIVTRLKIYGQKENNNKWKIDVKGSAYDGRQFFKSIFSTGQVVKNQPKEKVKTDVEVNVDISTVLGYSDAKVNNLRLFLRKTEGRLTAFEAKGYYDDSKVLIVKLKYDANENRILRAETDNAGHAFRMIGFYPNIEDGQAALEVNLDAKGAAEQSGTLWVRKFNILGDEVVQEVLSGSPDETGLGIVNADRQQRRTTNNRQRITFDQMKVPFSVGNGQFVLHDSFINGPSMGATLRGKINFEKKQLDLGGTYIPLYALNTVFKGIPILDQLLGRHGILGITFAIQGSMNSPQVLVNPASMVAPGILRNIFQFQGASDQQKISE